jgi:hypothetical protein
MIPPISIRPKTMPPECMLDLNGFRDTRRYRLGGICSDSKPDHLLERYGHVRWDAGVYLISKSRGCAHGKSPLVLATFANGDVYILGSAVTVT